MAQSHDEYGHTVTTSGTVGQLVSLESLLHAAGAGKGGGTWNADLEPYASLSIRTDTGSAFLVPYGDTATTTSFIFGESGAVLGPWKYAEPPSVAFTDTQTVYINLVFPNGGR